MSSEEIKSRSQVIKAGMNRLCNDFTDRVVYLGFERTNSRSRMWEQRGDAAIRSIYFHRMGSTYGGPISHHISIRVEFLVRGPNDERLVDSALLSTSLRDEHGYGYHTRFNALSWSMYERCLDDLVRVTVDHGLEWFHTNEY